jgi:hypothetical protein
VPQPPQFNVGLKDAGFNGITGAGPPVAMVTNCLQREAGAERRSPQTLNAL